MLAIWSLILLPFLNPACTSRSSRFTYCWSLAWRILSITLLACEMNAVVWYFEYSLTLPFFGIGMKKLTFSSPVATAEFSKLADILSVALLQHHLLGLEIAQSPPLALFAVMLPKAHLTSRSRISSSRWVTMLWWLSLRPFVNSSSVHSSHICFCKVLTFSVFYHAYPCMKCSLVISSFIEEISFLSNSVVFLYFLHY